jgi:hypothetical protein
MTQLEDLAAAMVTELTTGLADLVEAETLPAFTAHWDYDVTYKHETHKPSEPVDVLIVPQGEDLDLDTPVNLFGDFNIDIGIRQKLTTYKKEDVTSLRQLSDAIFYYWFPRAKRRLTAVGMTWSKTQIQLAFDPTELRTKNLFFAVATLTFQGTRDE